MAKRKTTSAVSAVGRSKKQDVTRREPRRYTLQDAFSPGCEDTGMLKDNFDLERALRSVAFLMHSLSEIGNKPVDGFIVHGLATVLSDYADQLGARTGRN